jgi:hypothetical protein
LAFSYLFTSFAFDFLALAPHFTHAAARIDNQFRWCLMKRIHDYISINHAAVGTKVAKRFDFEFALYPKTQLFSGIYACIFQKSRLTGHHEITVGNKLALPRQRPNSPDFLK